MNKLLIATLIGCLILGIIGGYLTTVIVALIGGITLGELVGHYCGRGA
jgi:hypothetical protein